MDILNSAEPDLIAVKDFVKKQKKGELHVHLNGLIPTESIKELLILENVVIPAGLDPNINLNITQRAESLVQYLKPWELLRLVPNSRNGLSQLVKSAFESLKNDNVSFVELRNSVTYIAKNNGITLTEALSWIIEDIRNFSALTGIKSGLILTVTRSTFCKDEMRHLIKAYEELGCPDTVIGLDIAGNEDIEIDLSIGQLLKYAKDKHGLGITIHAGETGKIDNIRIATDVLYADRIGHGTVAGNYPDVLKYLKQKDICLEVCLVSNMLTNAVSANERHPVKEFIKYGVPFVLASDNPGIHRMSLTDDYLSFYMENKNSEILEEMYERQCRYTFLRNV